MPGDEWIDCEICGRAKVRPPAKPYHVACCSGCRDAIVPNRLRVEKLKALRQCIDDEGGPVGNVGGGL